jgi:hypothetical protein
MMWLASYRQAAAGAGPSTEHPIRTTGLVNEPDPKDVQRTTTDICALSASASFVADSAV